MASRGTERRADPLATYRSKRSFDRTPEPAGGRSRGDSHLYTIQKHAARRLHYDLRLELDGVLKSWAVTKGPSLDPRVKRLAVRTEDHPVEYATFEGKIPEGNYGAGTVLLWDRGTWSPIEDPRRGLEKGKLVFNLQGERLRGRWALVRFHGSRDERRENWLLIKERDGEVDRDRDVTDENTTSVASGRDIEAIAESPEAVWHSDGKGGKRGAQPTKPRAKRRRANHALPAFVEPALATLVDEVPQGENWVFEVKFDGYRALAAASGDEVRIYTRSGLDWTTRYPAIAKALAALDLPGVLLDGEIVVIDDRGRSNFGALQNALSGKGGALSYFVFDMLEESGKSLRAKVLRERKTRLQQLLSESGRRGPVFYTDHIERDGAAALAKLCDTGFEGVIAKRADAPYRSGRGRSWLKIKCGHEQEFVIVGWSPSDRNRPFSSLLLGLHEDGALRYAGRIGTGFSAQDLKSLARRFREIDRKPVGGAVPRDVSRKVHWVKPELVAQVAFAGFTRDGLVRQGRFLGLREDKNASTVRRETPKPVREETQMAGRDDSRPARAATRLTHPDKVLYPKQGITKQALADYVEAVADRMLPHVANRLLTLLRCPEGQSSECFFQRHGGRGLPKAFHELPVAEKKGSGKRRYLYIEDRGGLLAAVQMGVLELHIWGSRIDKVDQPDRIVFDLDPDPTVGFDAVKQGARRLREVLEALDLRSFPMLTGGKGVHVVVPIRRGCDWPVVKDFARSVAERIVADAPDRYVATMTKAKRKGRIFIDYFRNDRTATAIAPYSTRRHEGAPLAWPVTWRELDGASAANEVTIEKAAARLRKPDPWKDYGAVRQALKSSVLRALGVANGK